MLVLSAAGVALLAPGRRTLWAGGLLYLGVLVGAAWAAVGLFCAVLVSGCGNALAVGDGSGVCTSTSRRRRLSRSRIIFSRFTEFV